MVRGAGDGDRGKVRTEAGAAERARYPVAVAVRRSGLSAHTIRAWERRYGAVIPRRSAAGHRLYSDGELRRLRILADLTRLGHRIGEIAGLPTDHLEELLRREDGGRPAPAGAGQDVAGILAEMDRAVREFDAHRLDTAFRRGALRLPVDGLVDEVVAPFLRGLGRDWRRGRLTPAQEHLASGVAVRTLGWVMNSFRPPADAPSLVVATPTGQRHNLGAMLAAASAAAEGWNVTYLGGELPGRELGSAAARTGARGVALSLVHPDADPGTRRQLRELRRSLPRDAAVLVGGRAAPSYAPVLGETGAVRLEDFRQLRRALGGLR